MVLIPTIKEYIFLLSTHGTVIKIDITKVLSLNKLQRFNPWLQYTKLDISNKNIF